ncbi:MAG: hypothetical protein SFU27_01115 [Thermonemataceae bacterium]|nr:hypothetical protein [Thermonemataceae bacterium]
MKKKLLILILFWQPFVWVQAQSAFTPKEMISFYELYEFELNHPFDLPQIMPICLAQTKVSPQRMEEIMRAQASGKNAKISEEEKVELTKLQELLAIEEKKYKEQFDTKLETHQLLPATYKAIKIRFAKDITFQKEVYNLYKKHKNK